LPFDADARVTHYRVDAAHSNAYAEWERQGRPNYPSPGQYEAIKARDGLETCEAPRVVGLTNGTLALRFDMPVHAVSLLLIERA
jgi:xylan 1,4-beta-xylosidase